MTPDDQRPWPTISPLKRWGPLALVLAVLIGGTVVATAKGSDSGDGTTASAPSKKTSKGYADSPLLPVTYADAKEAGSVDDYDWGDRCDTERGTIKVPSVLAPPCVPVWDGDEPWKNQGGKAVMSNGGATAPGVTEDTITIVYYQFGPQDLGGALQSFGVMDPPQVAAELAQQMVDAGNSTFELYGRKVVLKPFQATGDGKSPGPARADAIKVAKEIKAFASIGGPTQTAAYQDELARQGVLCIACGYATPDAQFQKNAPYAWSQLPTADQIVYGVIGFGIENLFGKPAVLAGDPAMQKKKRVFGVVHYEQDPPVFDELEEAATAKYEKDGFEAKANLSYLLDLDTLDSQAQTIIGKLKAAKVTSVMFLGDPLMPIYLTKQATQQDYHPEWIITGTVFTDSTSAGRLYDQTQWAHAFGASSLPARTKPELSEPWRIYEWYFGEEPTATKSLPVVTPLIMQVFGGLMQAGPNLSAQTFAGGMFRLPPAGGGPTVPRVSYGFHGLFDDADYAAVDDFAMVYWDPDAEGPDEQNKDGKGMWRYVDGGKRFLLGEIESIDLEKARDPASAPTLLDEVPEEDRVPGYPPWPGSPAAAGGG